MWFLSRERGRKKRDLSEERSPNSLHFGEEYKIEGHLVKFKVPRAECLCGSSKVYVRTVALAWCWHLSPSIFQGYSEKPEAGLHHKLSLTETDWLNLHLFLKDKHMGKGPEIHLPVSGAKENWSLSSSPSSHMRRDETRVGVSEEGQCLVNNECMSQEAVLGCQSHEHPDTRQCKDCKGQQMRCSAEERQTKRHRVHIAAQISQCQQVSLTKDWKWHFQSRQHDAWEKPETLWWYYGLARALECSHVSRC